MAFLEPDNRIIMKFHCTIHISYFEIKYSIHPKSNLTSPLGYWGKL